MIEYWYCDECNEQWAIQRAQDGWDGDCPSCGEPMEPSTQEEYDAAPCTADWLPDE